MRSRVASRLVSISRRDTCIVRSRGVDGGWSSHSCCDLELRVTSSHLRRHHGRANEDVPREIDRTEALR
jgi:hypothetical protein